ncbi:MAG TPA: APH(3') family aminoglycoside O-phosphotransferase [Caulobacteraceae bacterium]|jgi:aminoglycoside phosphotransferase
MTEPEVAELARALMAAAAIEDFGSVARVGHGESGDVVVRIDGAPVMFAKFADASKRVNVVEIAAETAALRWLQGRAPVPRLMWAGEVEGRSAILTEAVMGTPLHELLADQAEAGAVAALHALAQLHALPVADCPLDQRLDVKLAEARRRVEAGEIDVSRLDPDHAGKAPLAIFEALIAERPTAEDLVVTHGDASWPNFILRPDGAVVLIDVGRAGVADRSQDLALFRRSAIRNFPDLPIDEVMAQAYPVPTGRKTLEFYRLLDELF